MRLLLLAFWLCLMTLPAQGDELAQLQTDNRLLKVELDQARKGQVYFSFDLAQKLVAIKVSGLTLAQLPVTEVRSWGASVTATTRTITKKSARQEPKREQIVIPPSEQASSTAKLPAPPAPAPAESEVSAKPKPAFELQALELNDMPRDYQITFDDGLQMTVHGVEGEIPSFYERAWWYLSRPLISDWHFFKGKSYTELRLIMPLREARMLYWSSSEGSLCLFLQPRP